MTPEQMRIALAEWDGCTWSKPVYQHDGKWWVTLCKDPTDFDSKWAGEAPPFEQCNKDLQCVPPYPASLDAVHELEKKLPDLAAWIAYVKQIGRICMRTNNAKGTYELSCQCFNEGALAASIANFVHATAAQRCEALCRVLFPERLK